MPGYDARTVEPLKTALICPECSLVLRDAVQTGDGVRLCESCYDQIYQYPNRTSPKSGTTVGEEYHPDKAVRREILQLLVQCAHHIYGCPWTGQIQHFEGHCQDCKYKPMRCPNPGCNELMPAGKLDRHVDEGCEFRMVACDYCREGTTANQLEEHQNRCPKVPVECERCSEWVVRDELREHQLRDCPLVKCPGCEDILERNGDEEKQNTTANHLKNPLIVFQHIMTLFAYLNNCLQKVGRLQLQFSHLENSIPQHTVHPGQLAKVCAEMQHTTKELLDRIAVLERQNGGGTQATKDKNLHAKVYNLEASQKQAEQVLRTLRSQQQSIFASLNSVTGSETRIMELEKRVEELFRQQNALKTHIAELEMQLQASLASTHNGSFLWRIPDVSRRKRDAVDKRIVNCPGCEEILERNAQCLQIVGQLQLQFSHLENSIPQHTVQLTKFHAEMQRTTKELLERMAVLEKQNGGGTQDRQASSRTGGARELRPSSRGDFNYLRHQVTSYPTQASASCNASEVRYLQPSFDTCKQELIRHNEQQMSVEQGSRDGSCVWRISDVSQRRLSSVAERSLPFYTGQNGYKVRIGAYLNGDGSGHNTHISVFFEIMKGDYDPLLKWPFDNKVTFILVDQTHRRHIWDRFESDRDNQCFHRPQSDTNVLYNRPQFAELSVLDDPRYVKDDVMYIKCVIDTSRIFHP